MLIKIALCVSFAEILRWIAYPVKPFVFEQVQGELLPPVLPGHRDRMGKEPDLFEKADRHLADELQYVHPESTQDWLRD